MNLYDAGSVIKNASVITEKSMIDHFEAENTLLGS